jgi:transcriptional regulator with XRE-family HTH domain
MTRRQRRRTGLAARIRHVRTGLGLPQTRFAPLIGVRRLAVNRYEAGRRTPRPVILVRIARVGGVTVDWLLKGTADGRPSADSSAWAAALQALQRGWADPMQRARIQQVLREASRSQT